MVSRPLLVARGTAALAQQITPATITSTAERVAFWFRRRTFGSDDRRRNNRMHEGLNRKQGYPVLINNGSLRLIYGGNYERELKQPLTFVK
jgi:hypothetical protein